MTDEVDVFLGTGAGTALQIEQNGINVIGEAERKGSPRQLFWPWFGANISVLGLSYGSWVLGFGISFWQAIIVDICNVIAHCIFAGMLEVYIALISESAILVVDV